MFAVKANTVTVLVAIVIGLSLLLAVGAEARGGHGGGHSGGGHFGGGGHFYGGHGFGYPRFHSGPYYYARPYARFYGYGYPYAYPYPYYPPPTCVDAYGRVLPYYYCR